MTTDCANYGNGSVLCVNVCNVIIVILYREVCLSCFCVVSRMLTGVIGTSVVLIYDGYSDQCVIIQMYCAIHDDSKFGGT